MQFKIHRLEVYSLYSVPYQGGGSSVKHYVLCSCGAWIWIGGTVAAIIEETDKLDCKRICLGSQPLRVTRKQGGLADVVELAEQHDNPF